MRGPSESSVDPIEADGESSGVVTGVGTASFPGADVCFPFFCFLDTHGVPWSSCTCKRAAELDFHMGHASQITHQVKVDLVLEQVQALDDVLVVHEAEEHDLRGDAPKHVVLPPRVLGHLVLDDELHRDLMVLYPVARSHDEAVSAGAKLVLEAVLLHKEGVENVLRVEPRGVQAPLAEHRVLIQIIVRREGRRALVMHTCGGKKK